MEAWIYVARSPLFAVTGPDGRFSIKGIPPGTYKTTASHATLGTERFEVTIDGGKVASRDLTFRSR
jgi:hypothetical protein